MAQPSFEEIATRHQVFLEGLKSGEVNQFADFLLQIDRSLRARLGGEDLTAYSRTRLEKLLAVVERDLHAIYGAHWEQLRGSLIDTAVYEAEFEAKTLGGAVAGFETVVPADVQIIAAVTSRPLSVRGPDGGKLLEPFVKDWSATEVKRVSGAIRQGFFEGQTTSQILQAVRGTRANGFRDGILAISSRNADAVVRTAVQHAASVARQVTWEANADIIAGVRWVSTLDGRTSQQCRSLDGRVFPIDKGPRPPIHIRCRSTTVPELNDVFAVLGSGSTRASKDGQVSANLTYYEWLKKQPAAFQDQAIGPARAKLLRDGGLSAERFAELNLGKNFEPLTLAQMRKLEPLAFEKAYEAKPFTKQAENARLSESSQRDVLESWMGAHAYRLRSGEVENPRIKKQADEYGLSQSERVALRHYTGAGYYDLNRQAWGLPVENPEAVKASADVLRAGLDKLPSYEGTTYRRTTLPPEVLAQHVPGRIVEYPAFTSTSHSGEVFEGDHRIVINGKSGRAVDWISQYNDSEREVLFSPPLKLRVRERYVDDDGVLTIVVTEL